jgi:MazG family protein
MSQLRDKDDGCEWDKEQTFKSIAPFTIEEAYEVADAIERENISDLKEELGDLLLQVVFLSQIAKEEELFSFDDVAKTISEKLVRRHPFVFSDKKNHSSEEQINQWEEIKQKERSKKNQEAILDGIAKNLPSLQRSQKIQKRVSSVGFDWPDTKGVFEKIKEELRELEEAVESNDKESIQEEIGDLYMIITNLSEKLGVDSEEALRRSNVKFEKRFNYIEKELGKDNIKVSDMDLDELNTLWDDSKKLR